MARLHQGVDLPLRYDTPDSWAASVLSDAAALLSDHAHLEKAAAANALELLARWPATGAGAGGGGGAAPQEWVATLGAVARDEVDHLNQVTRLLAKRGGSLGRRQINPYANGLRKLVRLGKGNLELLDRLLVAALIEARSCERFDVLARRCDDADLAKLYRGLFASEHGHYLVFLDLARYAATDEQIDARWDQLLDAEAELIVEQPTGPRMHSGAGEAV